MSATEVELCSADQPPGHRAGPCSSVPFFAAALVIILILQIPFDAPPSPPPPWQHGKFGILVQAEHA
jgi:hypothetical protein